MCGRAGVLEEETGKWSNVTYMPCTSENNFIPEIPDKRIDIVYLCYPNNPTGTTLTKPELKKWVDYALANDTLILFDAAYEAYIQDEMSPTLSMRLRELKSVRSNSVVFQNGRIYRSTLRIYRSSERAYCRHIGRRPHPTQQIVEPPPMHQVQRYFLHYPTGSRSRLQCRRQSTD